MKSIVRFAFFALPLMGIALSGAASSPFAGTVAVCPDGTECCYTPDCCNDTSICCPDGEVCVATSAESVAPVVSLAAVAAASTAAASSASSAAASTTGASTAFASMASSGDCGPCPTECCD